MTTFTNDFSKEVYESTYKIGEETIDETHKRICIYLASIEEKKDYYEKEFLEILRDFKFIPGGRIISNAGLNLKGTTMLNCFLSAPLGEDIDSMSGIHRELGHQMQILQSEGGYGFCASFMRPRGAFIQGIANYSPGSVEMLNMWDTSSQTITSGAVPRLENKNAKKKIRKGAQMVTLHCWHPDICEFITAKQQAGRLTKFNMSVLITDEFMSAVKNNKSWNLEFPDYEKSNETYHKLWDGDLAKWRSQGLPIKIYHSFENANELYNLIMESTYKRNEPGVLFIDTINKMNNLHYCETIQATNPCVTDDTWIHTSQGSRQVSDLLDEPFKVVINGKEYNSTSFWKTGVRTVYKICTHQGFEVTATENHRFATPNNRWTQVKDLKENDKLCLSEHDSNYKWPGDGTFEEGLLLGDGTITQETARLSCWDKDIPVSRYPYGVRGLTGDIPRNKTSSDFQRGFLRGLFDADGSVQGNLLKGISIRLSQSDINVLFIVQQMLARLGIISTIYKNRRVVGKQMMPNSFGGYSEYNVRANHELVISRINWIKFIDCIGFSNIRKQTHIETLRDSMKRKPNKENYIATIKSITKLLEPKPVYDCNVDNIHSYDANGFLSHNCGEQPLPPGGVCLLGSINLSQFVADSDWDYEKLERLVPIAIRMLDNVNDLSKVPLEIQVQNLKNKRRIGLGILGYASALLMMKIKYGGEKAINITHKLMKKIRDCAYEASINLAIEKGVFPLFESKKYLESKFIATLPASIKKKIEKHGIRNSHLLSIQPTGNTSVFANNVSGGLEPIWQPVYTRTTIIHKCPIGLHLPTNIDWINKKYKANGTDWRWKKEGDENLLYTSFENRVWKVDSSRGLVKETILTDYGVHILSEKKEWNPEANWVAMISNISLAEHLSILELFSKYVDGSISKTVNLPEDFSFVAFKKLYMDAYDTQTIKGITTYRDKTMSYVLSSVSEITPSVAPKRPICLQCNIHPMTYKKVRYIVLVGLLNNKPYEVFSFKEMGVKFTPKMKTGKLTKINSGVYNLETESVIFEDLNKHFDKCEESLVTRLISLSLKHGVDINEIYDQLQKSDNKISSFSRVIARTLSQYVSSTKDACGSCNSKGIIFQEGCIKCKDCGWSKC